MHDDSDSDDLEPLPNFEPLQLLGYDRSRLEQGLTQNFKDWNFDCELVEPDVWRVTHLGEGSRFVLLRREPAWHIEAHGFEPKVPNGRTFKVPRVPDFSADPLLTRAERAEAVAWYVVERFVTRVWPRLLSRRERPRRRRPR